VERLHEVNRREGQQVGASCVCVLCVDPGSSERGRCRARVVELKQHAQSQQLNHSS
jgi:hypothetical protein